MYSDFYTALAQVLPVLLLALMWDSAYLERLRHQRRAPRAIDPGGVRFWTKPRVRAYTLTVASVVIACICAAVLVLAGIVGDSRALRTALTAGTFLVLATLLTRISVDVIIATRPGTVPARTDLPRQPSPAPGPGQQATVSSGRPGLHPEDVVPDQEGIDRADNNRTG